MNWKTALSLGAVIVVALLVTQAIQEYKAKQALKRAAAAAGAAAAGVAAGAAMSEAQ